MIKIIQGNCLAVMRELPKKSFDVVVTSPPYNLDINYGSYKDRRSIEDYVKWFEKISIRIKKIMRDDGSFFLNVAGSASQPYLPHLLICMLQKHFILQNTIYWIKSISIGNTSSGHYKPVNSKRYLHNGCEYIFHLTKTGKIELDMLSVGVPYADKSNIARRGHAQDLRSRGNTWFLPYTTKNSKSEHPCEFPIELPQWCIKLHGKKSANVLDPFAGICNTGIAAVKENCSFTGIELDKHYCKIGAKHLKAKVTVHENK